MSYIGHPRTNRDTVEVVALGDIPADWESAWRDLAEHASEPAPFAESWFLQPSIEHLPLPSTARMLTVWQGPVLIGLLPLCIAPRYGRTVVRHVQNWQHYHVFLGTPLVRAGTENAFWAAALAELDHAKWASSFLHLTGLVAGGPVLAALRGQRRADIVHRSERALLKSELSSEAYYEANIRKKKRKEIGRLRTRLGELGEVAFDRLPPDGPVTDWTATFLHLESSGWKGRAETALSDDPATKLFFEQAIAAAFATDRLEMIRLTLDGKPIAMLVNFITPPGSFSFKIAFDENYARYSPGVLIQLENLKILDRKDVDWMDSCAVEDHSMINSIWAERRAIVRVTVPLRGKRRTLVFNFCRALENASARFRALR
jgi:CelD/BcsL family acetyltransferase involved in cellulose biosynthesis